MTKLVLITGGTGYVGGRIANELAKCNKYKIRLAGRGLVSAPNWLPEAEVAAFDLNDIGAMRNAMQGVHSVIHLAAMNEIECVKTPVRAIEVNCIGTANIIESAIAESVQRLLYFSTAHVYCSPLEGDITEARITRPNHPYAITHRAAEDLVLAAGDQQRISSAVLRLSNGFGTPMSSAVDRWTLLVNDLCRQASTTKKMELRSSGLQQRDFITLQDVGRASAHILELTDEKLGDGLYNLGGDSSMSVLTMAKLISQRCKVVLGFTPELLCPSPDSGEHVPKLHYDMQKLHSTGFELVGDFENEIDSTLELCVREFKGR